MLEDVVVAWDGSERSHAALEWALERRSTRSVRLVHVIEDDEIGDDLVAGARIALESRVDLLRADRPAVRVRGEIVRGDVEAVLLAESLPHRLLVLGTGGRLGTELPGRSALLARIARRARGPVALVPLQAPTTGGPVVVGVDGTATGTAAAQIAAAEAAAQGVPVLVVHVHRGPHSVDDAAGDVHGLAMRFPHLLVRQRAVRGDVVRELARSAAGAALLVLGHDDHSGPGAELEHEAVVGMPCPLLLVRDVETVGAVGADEAVRALAG